jgi:hypothetical protein
VGYDGTAVQMLVGLSLVQVCVQYEQSGYGKSVKQPYRNQYIGSKIQTVHAVRTLSFDMLTTVVFNTDKQSSSEYFHNPPM